MLKTRMKQPASPLRRVRIFMLLRIALKTFVSRDMPTKKSKRCIVYHYTPTKLPKNDEITKTRIDRNPDSYVCSPITVCKIVVMKVTTGATNL